MALCLQASPGLALPSSVFSICGIATLRGACLSHLVPDPKCPRQWPLVPGSYPRPRHTLSFSWDAADGLWIQHCSHVHSLFCRHTAPSASLLHRPWRTRHDFRWQPHGNGFPGPATFTPGKYSLPTAPFLLQHSSASLRTGGEGQVRMLMVPTCVTVQGTQGEARPLDSLFPSRLLP